MFDTDLDPRLRGGDLVRPRSALVLRRRASPARSATRRRGPGSRAIGDAFDWAEYPQSLDFPRDGDCERSGAGRLAARGPGGGPRPRGPPRHLPQHAASRAASRSAGTSSTSRGRSPARSTPGRGNEAAAVGVATAMGAGGRRHAAPPRHGRPHHARRRAVADLRAVHGPRRRARRTAATATSTWPTRSLGLIAMVSHLPAMLPVAIGCALAFRIRDERARRGRLVRRRRIGARRRARVR